MQTLVVKKNYRVLSKWLVPLIFFGKNKRKMFFKKKKRLMNIQNLSCRWYTYIGKTYIYLKGMNIQSTGPILSPIQLVLESHYTLYNYYLHRRNYSMQNISVVPHCKIIENLIFEVLRGIIKSSNINIMADQHHWWLRPFESFTLIQMQTRSYMRSERKY